MLQCYNLPLISASVGACSNKDLVPIVNTPRYLTITHTGTHKRHLLPRYPIPAPLLDDTLKGSSPNLLTGVGGGVNCYGGV